MADITKSRYLTAVAQADLEDTTFVFTATDEGVRKTPTSEFAKSSQLLDYIVEQGTSGIWTYRKWNSGIAECWCIYSFSTTINNAWGSLYESPQINPVSYPFTFKEIPFLSLTPASGSYVFFVDVGAGADTTKTGIMWVSRPTAVTSSITCKINIHAIGKWK